MSDTSIGRRGFLRASAAATAGAAVAGGAASATAAPPGFDGWLSNVSNYDGVADETGKSEVTIEVGAQGNNGGFAFGPAAVRVDPGTTVVWEWTGKGGSHNVVAKDGSFESELTDETGFTFSQTFEETGVRKYFCRPHKPMGMKGVVVVGDVSLGGGSDGASDGGESDAAGEPDYGDWFSNVSNFDGTVDETGKSEVTVTVGADGNDGGFAFGPAAVRVDPGTTVVWEWTGKGGSHNVIGDDGGFESELTGETGHTFSHTFESEGVYKYFCRPHKAMGMKGAVVVGSGGAAESGSGGSVSGGDGGQDGVGGDPIGGSGDGFGTGELLLAGSFGLAMLSPALFGVFMKVVGDGDAESVDVHRRETTGDSGGRSVSDD